MIRNATQADGAGIAAIYNHYIEHTTVSFEVEPVSNDVMSSRIEQATREYPWLVLLNDARIIGYAYVNRWQSRCAYRQTVESTIYIAPDCFARGHGTRLYTALFDKLTDHPIHSFIAGISLPNEASVSIHEKFGFKKVAHYTEVGRKFDRWIDVGYWQKMAAI